MKIDMVFMKHFETNPEAKVIIQAMINLAKEIGMQPLNEGVETDEQFEFIKEAGSLRAQGYLFSSPKPWSGIQELIDSGKLEWSEEFLPENRK